MGDDDKMATFGFVVQEIVDLADCTIVGNDRKALIVHVQNQILTLVGEVISRRRVEAWRLP